MSVKQLTKQEKEKAIQKANEFMEQINNDMLIIEERINKLALICGKLNALSPLATLSRGYSVAFHDGAVVNSTDKINLNDIIKIRVSDGEITAEIRDKRKF